MALVNNSLKEKLGTLYLCFMVVYMVVREVLPLNFLIDNIVISIVIFLTGFALVLWDLLTDRNCFNSKTVDFFAVFIIVAVVSSIVNYKYGVAENIKCIAAMVLECFVFFSVGFRHDGTKKFKLILNTLVVTVFIFNFISLGMYFFSIDYSIFFDYIRDQGFDTRWGRLMGIYNDPNVMCYVSLVAIFASAFFIKMHKTAWSFILNGINILVQMTFVTLVLSRSATVVILVVPFLCVIYPFLCFIKENKKKAFVSLLAALLVSCALYGTTVIIKTGVPYVKVALLNEISVSAREKIVTAYDKLYIAGNIEILNINENHTDLSNQQTGNDKGNNQDDPDSDHQNGDIDNPDSNQQDKYNPGNEPEKIERKDEKDDYSNGRFDRWKGGIEVFKTTPLLGTSPRNAIAIAKERTPNTVMGKYGWVTHCSYFEILVNTGVLGALALFGAFVYIAVCFIKTTSKKGFDISVFFAFLCFLAIAVGVFFVSDVFFVFTINSLLFFYLFGYLSSYAENDKKSTLNKLLEQFIFKNK